jgi:hypothetical protein
LQNACTSGLDIARVAKRLVVSRDLLAGRIMSRTLKKRSD